MTSTNTLGIRNGNQIIPYGAATKQTKVISITNVAHLVVTGTNLTANTILGAYVQAYADSTGQWRLRFNIHCPVTSTGARTSATLTFSSTYAVVFKSGPYQACSSFLGGSGAAVTARTTSNAASIYMAHASASETEYQLSGDVELESEPAWAAANMEGAVNASVYIKPASATETGLVTAAAQTIAGVKDFTNGIKLAAGTALTAYEEGSWTPTRVGEANITGTPAFGGTNTYTRIGNTVFARISTITGAAITTAGNNTQIRFTSTGLPGVTNTTQFYGSAHIYIASGNYEQLAGSISDDASNTTDIWLAIASHSGVVSGESLTILSLYLSYSI